MCYSYKKINEIRDRGSGADDYLAESADFEAMGKATTAEHVRQGTVLMWAIGKDPVYSFQ